MSTELNVIWRAVQAYRDGRVLSATTVRMREELLRFRLGLSRVRGGNLPSIITSGDFSSSEGRALKEGLEAAIDGRSKLTASIRAIKGFSGQRYRTLINTLIETLNEPRYLEIGSLYGSTAAAAIYGNRVQAVCVDNWSLFSGSREKFLANIDIATSWNTDLRLVERDFRSVDFRMLGRFNVYLFDGPHSEVDHRDGICLVQTCLDERFVLIVDDWNWRKVRLGTMSGLLVARCCVEASVQVRTTLDNNHVSSKASGATDWHNGYFIAVVRKRP